MKLDGAPFVVATAPRPRALSFLARPQTFVLLAVASLLLLTLPTTYHLYAPRAAPLSAEQHARFQADLQKCSSFARPPHWERERVDPKQRVNPRFSAAAGGAGVLVLKNAIVFDGEKWLGKNDIVVQHGVVSEIVPEVAPSVLARADVKVVNVDERFITPGLIDMHSHSGLDTYPSVIGTSDINEMSAIITPYSRVLDAINPHDPAHGMIASGGVTTSLIIPGSGNVMGGEGVAIKNKYLPKNTIEAMLLEPTAAENRTRWMKMACGENPKRAHAAEAKSRMGLSHVLRAHMAKAGEIKAAQDTWCAKAQSPEPEIRKQSALMGLQEDLEYEFTIAMLRGQVHVNIHCYETMDIEAMLRHANEFGYRITAFHHAIDSYRVLDLLSSQGYNITQAMFAEHGLYKKEAYQVSLYAGKILADAGVPVAYKSDHPVSFAKHLVVQASIAHTFGLSEELALAAVMSVPAAALGLDDRIGYLREGYDADIVVWDQRPLSVGATPVQVYIDGERLLKFSEPDQPPVWKDAPMQDTEMPVVTDAPLPQQRKVFTQEEKSKTCEALRRADDNHDALVITGIRSSLLPDRIADLSSSEESLTLVLSGSKVVCLSSTCPLPSTPHSVISLENGHITTGLLALTDGLGLSEIGNEPVTQDGKTADVAATPSNLIFTKHGLHFGSKVLARAAAVGITRVITPPLHGGGILRGVSAAFSPNASSAISGIWRSDVALHVVIGQGAKGTATPTISGQIQRLSDILNGTWPGADAGMGNNDAYFARVAAGTFPLVVYADNSDDITQLVLLKRAHPAIKIAVVGGAEAWFVADDLAAAHIPVVLSPWRCAPEKWEGKRCLVGPPVTESPLRILVHKGVKIGLAPNADDLVRDLPMELGWARKVMRGISRQEAWDFGSRNLRDILDLPMEDEVVVWEGDPLAGAGVVVAVLGGMESEKARCFPEVE